MGFSPVRSAFAAIFHRIRTTAASLFPLGITSRLTISLVAVAVLAGTANMLARESVHIIRTVTHSREPNDSARLAAANSWVDLTLSQSKRANALAAALNGYVQATLARADSEASAGQADFLGAKDALQLATLDYKHGPGAIGPAAQVPDYLDHGQTVVRLADQRRQLRHAYASRADSIRDGIQSALDKSWKIFGRVITRQSLLELRSRLDELQQHADALLADEQGRRAAKASLIAAESSFAAVLNSDGLESAEGAAWVEKVRADFNQLADLRASLTGVDDRYRQAVGNFIKEAQSLSRAVAMSSIATEAKPSVPVSARQNFSPVLPSGTTVTETTLQGTDSGAPRLMAIVTALVMALIVAISVFTIRSIFIPVRRLVVAAGRLAGGEVGFKVSRGGIRELDVVAQAFNDMSAQLQAARSASIDHQESLEQKVLERTQRLQQLAQQDPLTKLPNRRHLFTLLNAAIDRAARQNRYLGVYFLDIDNFKNINDSLGHVFGDRVLMSVANRLEELADGFGFVARLGGDEFTVVFESAESVHAIYELGWALARAFQTLVSVDDRELSVSISVGASVFPDHESGAEELLRAADSALFRAKELGRSQLAVFTPELITTAAQRFSVEQGLRRAIERSEFELMYQPEVNVATLQVDLVEALLRWRLPDGRVVRPGEFLGIAEQSGLIAEINAWVLRAAVADASRWHHDGWPDTRVAINISSRQLLDHRFVERIVALLREYRLPARCIELELTETVLQTGATTVAALRALQSHGFGIALDDFGTGYSSLTSLEQLPLSRIKLDRTLVSSIDASTRSAAIARAVIDLCAGLGLQVTAEGIERPEQFAWFYRRSSILLQGYLLSDAVPFSDVLQVKRSLPNKLQDILLGANGPPVRTVSGPRVPPTLVKAR